TSSGEAEQGRGWRLLAAGQLPPGPNLDRAVQDVHRGMTVPDCQPPAVRAERNAIDFRPALARTAKLRLLAGGRVPDPYPLQPRKIGAPLGVADLGAPHPEDRFAVWAEGHLGDASCGPPGQQAALPTRQLPHAHRTDCREAVAAPGGHEACPVGAESHAFDTLPVSAERPDNPAAAHIPDEDRPVPLAHCQALAVRTVGELHHAGALPPEKPLLLASPEIPNPHLAHEPLVTPFVGLADRGKVATARAKGRLVDVLVVHRHPERALARLHLPDGEVAAITPGGQSLAIGAEGES